MSMLTIGKLAQATGVTADTLRYYEREGLLAVAAKSESGYRQYGPDAHTRVHFIKQAQSCGFTLAEIGDLLTLRASESACCGDVRQRALEKKLQLEGKIRALKTMSKALDGLIAECATESTSHPIGECPILAALADNVTEQDK